MNASDNNNEALDESVQKTIETWPHTDWPGLMAYVRERWAYADAGYWTEETDAIPIYEGTGPVRRYFLSTAGWSDNEWLIDALESNRLFWATCWTASRRGGRYIFEHPVNP